MKVLEGKKTLGLLAIVFVIFGACSKSEYTPYSSQLPETASRTEESDVTAADFDVLLATDTGAVSVTNLFKRTIADFFFYNNSHLTDATHEWGFVNDYDAFDGVGDGYGYASFLKTYWEYEDLFEVYGVLEDDFDFPLVSPAPMDVGYIRNIRVEFAFDLDEERGVIESDRAMLVLNVETYNENFYAKFSYSMISLKATGNDVDVTFADNCGKIFFHGTLHPASQTMDNIKITYKNSKSAYVDGACYYSGNLPKYMYKSTRIPNMLPSFIDTSGVNGELFQSLDLVLHEEVN
ncbi:MAG: hypothetical protein JXA66_04815 [Oligoflexia bacterium]|nr:hypothetical protein [Oligoflexia bacterium]